MKKNRTSILAVALALILCLGLVGCGGAQSSQQSPDSELSGGVLCLKVNPEIAITYDAEGKVTSVDSRNDDAKKILETYTGFEGKETRLVVSELVAAIGEAGYFVEEVEGEARQITIEIESGSQLPSDTFLDDVVADVRTTVSSNDWTSPVEVTGESDYGITDYVDTDYGPDNDGVTDYTAAAIGTDGSVTMMRDTDYGEGNDGITDYDNNINDDTDYGEGNDGVTDYDGYDGTDYGPSGDGATDYNDTGYGENNDGVTNYDDTDYGPNNDGVTDYDDGASNYDDSSSGASNYDDGASNYDDSGDDGSSDYDSGDSGYDD